MTNLSNIYFANLNALINSGDFFSIGPESTWRIDRHKALLNKFYYITKGSCTIWIDGKEYIGKAGSWFFIPAQTLHSYYNHKDGIFEKYWVHFDLSPSDTNLSKLLSLPYCIQVEKDRKSTNLFSKLLQLYQGSLTDRLEAKALLLQLLARYIHYAEAGDTIMVKSESDKRIDAALLYINENLDKPLYNKELADLCYVHPNHFIRFFKEKTGYTPASYIKVQKMEYARRLLMDFNLSIAEIADKIGMSDLSYFSNQFKSFFSLSPREYRKHYQNKKATIPEIKK